MTGLLPPAGPLGAFLAAAAVLAATPGPGVLLVVTRTVAQGLRHGLASIVGVALGNLANAWGAALGLAALIVAVPWAFDALRAGGAAWLAWLAWQALRARRDAGAGAGADPADDATGARAGAARGTARSLRDGFAVALLNPKTALFFAAFLPQFMAPDAVSPVAQAMALSALFVAIAAATDTVWVLLASRLAPRVARIANGRAAAWASASIYGGLAAAALLGDREG